MGKITNDKKENNKLKVVYMGTDDWYRHVYRGEDGLFYGTDGPLDCVKASNLTFFGSYFGCEPLGAKPEKELIIVEEL